MTTPPPPPGQYSPDGAPSEDARTMAMISHFGIIFGFLPPLLIFILKGDEPWVKKEAAKAFNFAIAFTIGYIAVFILNFIIALIDIPFIGCMTTLFYPALWIGMIIFAIQNGMRASNGEPTSYPFEIPLLKA